MPDVTHSIRQLLTQLESERSRLVQDIGRIDADIAQAQEMLRRRAGGPTTTAAAAVPREAGRASPPGEARREILALMSDGEIWTPALVARARATHPNAASKTLKSMATESEPPIRRVGNGRYVISSSLKGDEQGSLPVLNGSDEHTADSAEVGGS